VPTKVSGQTPGEVYRLKNGEPVMAGVLGGDYKDRMAEIYIYLNGYTSFPWLNKYYLKHCSIAVGVAK